MKCPYCSHFESKVLETRASDDGESIKRRRECLLCQKRFSSYEAVEHLPLYVIKSDGSRQLFDKQKIINGMLRACEKRPIDMKTLENIAGNIEQDFRNKNIFEIPTSEIGIQIMENLKEIDQVAYIRFVSVYRSFSDIESFFTELNKFKEQEFLEQ